MSSRHLQDVLKASSRCLQDLLQRYFQDVFKTYHQIKLFLLISLRDVCNTFLRRTAKRVIYRRIYSQCTKFGRVIKISQLLAFYFTTPFSGCLQRRISKTWSNICSGVFLAKILSSFKAAIFAKKLHHKCSTGLKIGF